MVQRRAARYVTNRYHNTSSVTSMLEHLDWETLSSRRTKAQLTMFYKISHDLIDIPAENYLTRMTRSTRASHSNKYRQISTSSSYYKNSFFPELFQSGIHYLHPLQRLLAWYPSSRGSPHLNSKPAASASYK